jgi:membrane-bound serine protease (ClpP class)
MMKTRLAVAIVTNILELAAIALVVLLALPRFGVKLPLWVLVVLMVAWLASSVLTYRKGTRALLLKPVTGLNDMTGCTGKVVKSLTPAGTVRIKGELWDARSEKGSLEEGEGVEVVKQEGLKLVVRKIKDKRY